MVARAPYDIGRCKIIRLYHILSLYNFNIEMVSSGFLNGDAGRALVVYITMAGSKEGVDMTEGMYQKAWKCIFS